MPLTWCVVWWGSELATCYAHAKLEKGWRWEYGESSAFYSGLPVFDGVLCTSSLAYRRALRRLDTCVTPRMYRFRNTSYMQPSSCGYIHRMWRKCVNNQLSSKVCRSTLLSEIDADVVDAVMMRTAVRRAVTVVVSCCCY